MAEHDAGQERGAHARLMQKRDDLLRELDALRNRAEGLNLAIKIIAEENPGILDT